MMFLGDIPIFADSSLPKAFRKTFPCATISLTITLGMHL